MLNEQLQRIKIMMRLNEATAPLDYDADYFIRRIPFLKTFKNFSNEKKVFFQKFDQNQNVKLMVGDGVQTFPQFNTSMEFTYMKDTISTGGYRHMFTVKNNIHIMPPNTDDRQEELTFRVLIMAFNMVVEKLNYSADIFTESPDLTDEQLNEVINGINKAYFDFEEFIEEKLRIDITNPLAEDVNGSDLTENLVINVTKNMEPAPYLGSRYGQDVEPKGTYVTQGFINHENYRNGKAVLRKPLFINVTDSTLIEYKRELAKKYKAKGQGLTNKLMNFGYDSIITVREDGEDGEIVLFPNASFMLS
jgi:hypothetical protein